MLNKRFNSIKDLCEYIWHLEEKYDLFNLKINDIHPWAAFRMDLYFELGKQIGVFEKKLNMKLSKKEKIIYFFGLFKNTIIHYFTNRFTRVDALIFSHARSQEVDRKLIDPYTFYLKKDLIKQKISFLEFESPYKGKHIRKKENYIRYLDGILILRNIKNLFVRIKPTPKAKETIKKLSEEINLTKNVSLDIKKFLLSNTRKFKPTYSFYLRMFKKTKPKKIYLVVSYGRGELIKAAKDLNIEVIELQHGTFSRYHLGYSFPNKCKLEYFPDKFYVWNQYWKNLIKLPIPAKKVIISPFHYLESEKQKYNNLKKEKDSLIIFGQGGITESIAHKIIENITYFQKFNITFKLHPNEYHMILQYKSLIHLQKNHNIRIERNINLYEHLAKSEYQAGVFSTALYEGIEFNCKTILFKLPGIEYMDQFIKQYNPIIK